MKTCFRYLLPALLAAILLASCALSLTPPNIPRTGGTITPSSTPLNNGTPAMTGTPAGTAGAQIQETATQSGSPNPIPIGSETATETPIATITGSPSLIPLPIPSSTQAGSAIPLPTQSEAIQFPANSTSYVVTTNLGQGSTKAYHLQASAGQRMYTTIDGNAVLQVFGPAQNAVTSTLSALNPVQIPFNQTGIYSIVLQGSGPIAMSVYIPAPNANQNVPAPLPPQLTPIHFQQGATSATFTVNASPGTPLGYTLDIQSGQQMTVITSGNSTLTLLAPDNVMLIPSAQTPVHQWLFTLNQSGNYTLILLGNGPVTITIRIPALVESNVTPTPIPLPGSATRVSFGAGNTSAAINTTLVSGVPKAYALAVNQGQILYVSTTGSVDVTIYGPANNVLVNGHAGFPRRWSAQANQTGDYIFVISGSGPCQLVFFIPPL